MLRDPKQSCKICPDSEKTMEKRVKNNKKENRAPQISRTDQEMIDELDYEYKKAHKPYDKWERHWDEA